MFDRFLEGNEYYDYPSFEVAVFSLLLALVLSTMVASTYRLTHKVAYSKSFFQAMVLSSLVTSMIMMAVGNNLAVGFGIIGAVAIIRFRTNIQNPRNVIFMFVALSVGIATGVYGYAVAIAGTLIFCGTAFLLRWSPYGSSPAYEYEVILMTLDRELLNKVKDKLKRMSLSFDEVDLRSRPETDNRYTFVITFSDETKVEEVFEEIQAMEGISEFRINRKPIFDQL